MKAFVFLGLSLVACGMIRMAQPIERRVLIPVSIAEQEMIYVDESGKEAISTVFWKAEPFQKDLALVLTKGSTKDMRYALIDRRGNIVFKSPWEIWKSVWLCEEHGVILVSDHIKPADQKAGVFDLNGNTIAPFEFEKIHGFDDKGMSRVTRDWKDGYIDTSGKLVLPLEWESIGVVQERGLDRAVARIDERAELIDLDDGSIVSSGWDALWPMRGANQGGLIVAVRDEKYGVIDLEGNEIVPLEWDDIDPWGFDGPLIVERDGLFGLLDRNGNTVVAPQWEYVGRWRNGMLTAMKDDLYGAVNRRGEVVTEFTPKGLSDFDFGDSPGYMQVKKWG